jgi:hypothetical protein
MSCAMMQYHVHTDWKCQQHCFENFKDCKLQVVSVTHFEYELLYECKLTCCMCVIKPT